MIADGVCITGAACIAYAAWLMHPALCWLVVGIELIGMAALAAKR